MTKNEDQALRLAEFRRITTARKLKPAALAEMSENTEGVSRKRTSFWTDLLAGKKSFGEKLAREIERMLGLSRGELDALIGKPSMTMRDLNGFEGQAVTLLRMLPQEKQDDVLRYMNEMVANGNPAVASVANPFPSAPSAPAKRAKSK